MIIRNRDCVGIIPAYAGSTSRSRRVISWPRDHPRIRGEHVIPARGPCLRTGSSPHTRGAPFSSLKRQDLVGIIPAYAGSTVYARLLAWASRDHPRIRGEHWASSFSAMLMQGSSPHTRGARGLCHDGTEAAGIIPAYAGSTSERQDLVFFLRDHPRIRGEHSSSESRITTSPGSSPHTRGAPALDDVDHLTRGIIPAYAGSTRS